MTKGKILAWGLLNTKGDLVTTGDGKPVLFTEWDAASKAHSAADMYNGTVITFRRFLMFGKKSSYGYANTPYRAVPLGELD